LAARSGQERGSSRRREGQQLTEGAAAAPRARGSPRTSAGGRVSGALFRRGEIDEGPTSPQLVLRELPVPLLEILLLDEDGREGLRHPGVVLGFRRATNPQGLRLSFRVGLLRFPLATFSRDHGRGVLLSLLDL